MRWLARLYPAGWRRRYGAELGTVLGAQRPSLRGALDVVLGALDAHLNPHLWRSPGPAVERLSEPGRRVLALAQEEASEAFRARMAAALARNPGPTTRPVRPPADGARVYPGATRLAGRTGRGADVADRDDRARRRP